MLGKYKLLTLMLLGLGTTCISQGHAAINTNQLANDCQDVCKVAGIQANDPYFANWVNETCKSRIQRDFPQQDVTAKCTAMATQSSPACLNTCKAPNRAGINRK
jgi:hypothetical protein